MPKRLDTSPSENSVQNGLRWGFSSPLSDKGAPLEVHFYEVPNFHQLNRFENQKHRSAHKVHVHGHTLARSRGTMKAVSHSSGRRLVKRSFGGRCGGMLAQFVR
ncbi:unnamed protein product [Ceratitis capitata]|uniref:(Mediterranean fruit fly) hypothetical protein n=1 Tax=Ceratitis capitata TaxID=7213 RepID=A0A811UN88_CERCA|nr:unnamed protein product [Ceratitis capitata]